MKFTYYTDAGHGWLKVPKKLLEKLGIEGKITCYSYQRGDYVYLEEDIDYATFANAYGLSYLQVVNKHTNRSSKIRSYKPYYLDKVTKTVNPASESFWSN